MDEKFNPASRIIISIVVAAVSALIFMFWLNWGGNDSDTLPFGDYVTTTPAAASESLDSLVQLDDCVNRSDQSCKNAMLSDGRVFLVKQGTLLNGSEIGYGVFEGRVHSGSEVGKMVYLPVTAVKAAP